MTIEEHAVSSGLGNIINHFLNTHNLSSIQSLNLGIPALYIEQGSHADIMRSLGLTPDQITQTIANVFELKIQPSTLVEQK